jgi:hypothetical protein
MQSICCKFPYSHYTFFHLFHVALYLSCPLISGKSMGCGLGLLLPPLFEQQLIMAECGFRVSPGIGTAISLATISSMHKWLQPMNQADPCPSLVQQQRTQR